MENTDTEMRKQPQAHFPGLGIYAEFSVPHSTVMLNQGELVAQLQARIDAAEITQGDVAKVLGVSNSRMTELFKHGTYQLRLDQAVKLVEAFRLEQPQGPQVAPVPAATARLVVGYVAEELGFPLADHAQLVEELAEDVQALSVLVADPRYRGLTEAADHFLQAMRVRRRSRQSTGRRERDRQNTQ